MRIYFYIGLYGLGTNLLYRRVRDEFNDLSYLIIAARTYVAYIYPVRPVPCTSSSVTLNLVTFAKFEPSERFKLTQLFVYHVHGAHVTHCVDGKRSLRAVRDKQKIIKIYYTKKKSYCVTRLCFMLRQTTS